MVAATGKLSAKMTPDVDLSKSKKPALVMF